MLDDFSKVSPHGSFQVSQLCESVAICEALKGDRYGWGNATNGKPAFLVYLGCQKDEVKGYVKTLNTFYRTEWCETRKPKYLLKFEVEIKIRGMQRYSNTNAFGLDYLLESSEAKHLGCNYDEYQHYATGVMQRFMAHFPVGGGERKPAPTSWGFSRFYILL